MARVTIKDCLEQVPNRFSLIHLAFQRVKQLRAGDAPRVQSNNKEVVVALREIAAGKVDFPFEKELLLEPKGLGKNSEKKGEDTLPGQTDGPNASLDFKEWTHVDAKGRAKMVNVSSKKITKREAIASRKVLLKAETLKKIKDNKIGKGDVLS